MYQIESTTSNVGADQSQPPETDRVEVSEVVAIDCGEAHLNKKAPPPDGHCSAAKGGGGTKTSNTKPADQMGGAEPPKKTPRRLKSLKPGPISPERLAKSGWPEGTMVLEDGTTKIPRPMTAQELYGYGRPVDGFHPQKEDQFVSCWAKRMGSKKQGRSRPRSRSPEGEPAPDAYDQIYEEIAKDIGYEEGFFKDSEYSG